MSLIRSTFVVTAATAVSRVLGFVRDVLLAQALGAGVVADAFLAVFRIPNLLRRVLSEGGLNAAFVPIYARLKAERGAAASLRFAAEALAGAALVLAAVVGLAEIAAAGVVLLVAAGYAADPAAHALAAVYLRAAMPFVLGAGLAALVSAVLNAERRVTAASLAPMAVNVALIAALVVLGAAPGLDAERKGTWLAAVTGVSGFLHLALVALAARRMPGALRLVRPRLSPEVKRLLAAGGPALAASGAAQLIVFAGMEVASFTPSALSWLYYADRLFQLPLGFVGAAVGMVLLPEIASRQAAGDHGSTIEAQDRALEAGLLLALPAAAALAILALPIVRVLFERGAFAPHDSAGTAAALAGLAAGLPPAVVGKILSQTFFARHDVRTPVFAGAIGMFVAATTATLLARRLGALGVGLGISLGFAAHAALLAWRLHKAGPWSPDPSLRRRAGAAVLATGAMAVGLLGAQRGAEAAFGPAGSRGAEAILLAGLCAGGLLLYGVTAWAVGAVGNFRAALRLGRR